MRHFAQLSLAVLLAASQLGPAASTAHAQQADNRVSLNFVDTDIPAVLRALSLFTQRNFLVDPRVKGKLTLVSDRPVDSGQALAMLTGALRLQGFAIVDVDGVTRVVPEADAKLQGSAVVGDPRPAPAGATGAGRPPAPVPVAAFAKGRGGSSGEMLTRVFPLKYENAANLVPVLRPMVPPNNPINAYPGNNTLVVTDYADNLERIASVIARIDVPSSIDTDVVPVRSGIASDIAVLASQLLDTQSSDPTQRIAVVADPRSNSVLVRAGSPARTRLARDLIMKLDAQQTRAGNLHVVYMRNAQATRIAEVLGGLLAGQANSAPGASGGASGAGGAPAGARAQNTAANNTAQAGMGMSGGSGSGKGGLSGEQERIARDDPGTQAVSYSAGGATIQADPATNSLIISAPEPLYRSLREVIDQLDQRRAQVLVESLIVEVSEEKAAEFGIQWMSGAGSISGGGTSFIGGTNLGGSGITGGGPTSIDALANGLSLGVVKGTVDVLGNEIINLGVLARAMQNTGEANILSTPNLLTLDNQSASILVGKTVPFVTGQYVTSGSNGSSNPFQTIEREDVGLKLNIRPQISEGGAVKLDIYQEVSSIDETRSSPTTGIVTNKRAIDTSVLIDDGQIIVLGGLLEDSVSLSSDAVPGLGSIPVLGALFRYDTRKRTKTNLMVFLRPYVVRDARRSASVTMDRYDYMRRAQAGAQPGKHWLLPDLQAPMLPPLGSAPSVSNNAYDMRPEQLADTMRRPPPVTVESFAVRQYPAAAQPADPALPIRVNLPRGVSVAVDPESLYGEADRSSATLQFASVEARADADKIAQRVRASGLQAYVQLGPGGMGYVVRSQVAKDPGTISTATALLRELGYKSEVVSQL
ncbi:Pullulanase secretion envelope pulD [Achromobacter denitrificans]|uniref:type II secretion system secretin GspD n=1 Tax=Achromobacter denitrificans TaxID=32002 RepID=UPI000788E04B|nr:type II secretion system secretin GspD [Achromobacter denitrificans]OLU01688.1 type II secretion system protein GspD [Achromobacter denitrificans]QKH40718.1 type II secretion system secretin GspD [Achromobacter denitrificans]QKH52136.1 type II secretion system secretin GspD [Achromobacter denitrificans]CAB3742651.1 Type 3 secretion system secretin [Achromobacter denitrificans]SUW33063.1 Pullulanase secretion envelope pulD [Achromobacter denitrificans]